MVGPADQIETNFSSDPPLSERDVRSLLVTGQIADPARGTTDSNTFAVGAVSGDVLGVAGQFVGLDTVSVGTEDLDLVSSDVDPATRLTVSKRLETKFELVLSENLEENESTWIVIYRPVSGYEFRLSSRRTPRRRSSSVRRLPSAPVSPRALGPARTVVQDKVRSVALAGEPGFSAEQVLAGTKLRQGDRFEFRAWLEDRDRIVRFYWDREYYTARVVPMRTAAESKGKERPVDLQYRIARGRRTVLEVTGYAAATISSIAFGRRGPQRGARPAGRQAHQGNPRASHRCRVPPRPDRGRGRSTRQRHRSRTRPHRPRPAHGLPPACVPRQPGARDSNVAGAHSVGSTRCQRVEGSGPADRCDPRGIRCEGYLAARVTIGPIEFADDAATLPIRIDEGRAAQVAAVQLMGVAPERRSGALEAIGLAVGSPFAAGADRSGRARLERYYRDLGFRDVHVESTATAASQGMDMALTFAVNEGPLHVISSVEIEGVQSTRPSLVSKAVQLTPGEPAGAAAAAATEKRLYELGTFRRAEVRLEPAPAPGPVQGVLPVKAIVSLEEARRFQLRYGLELSPDTPRRSISAPTRWAPRRISAIATSSAGDVARRVCVTNQTCGARSALLGADAAAPIRTNLFLNARGEEQRDEQFNARDDEVNLTIEQRWRSRAISARGATAASGAMRG